MGRCGWPAASSSRLGRSQLEVVMDEAERRLLADGAEQDLESFIGRLDVVDLTAERMKRAARGPGRATALPRPWCGRAAAVLPAGSGGVSAGPAAAKRPVARARAGWRARRRSWTPGTSGSSAGSRRNPPEAPGVRRLAGGRTGRDGADAVPATGGELRLLYRPSPQGSRRGRNFRFSSTFHGVPGTRATAGSGGRATPAGDRTGTTLVVELDGVDLRRFGSAGQVRAL